MMAQRALRQKIATFLREEGVAVIVSYGTRDDGGTITADRGGPYNPKDPLPPAMVAITPEHYNRIVRLLEHKVPVKVEIEVKNEVNDAEGECYNVIANIPGKGPHRDEVVMIGGHLDSWQGSTGATDNGAGSAVMLEVIRVLTASKLPLDRTVRIGLWGGEEEGLLGSREYVKKTFADPTKMETTPEWDKLSVYFNVDNGAGKIRGVYLQGNEAARPFFTQELAAFADMGVKTITIRNTGGTDHQSFDAVGLPGFQFIQDPLEYMTRTHHSNMDNYDRVPRGDMMQMAAVVSSMVYHAANRAEMIPRKPKPAPRENRPMF
jgi:Zn-dependent M28 family amino/carboxypeptidase